MKLKRLASRILYLVVVCILLITASSVVIRTQDSLPHQSSKAQPQYEEVIDGTQVSNQERLDTIQRAFLRLPPGELSRYGIDSIEGKIEDGTVLAQKLVEAWHARQLELQEVMKSIVKPAEHMANLTQQLQQIKSNTEITPVLTANTLHILKELDSLLTDIDNARDFHTINAWPTLVSFLADTFPTEIRSAAALAIGTSVKNSYDYQLWLVEPLELTFTRDQNTTVSINTTCLALLEQMLIESTSSHDNNQLGEKRADFQKKTLYALSAGMRGNMDVQEIIQTSTNVLQLIHQLAKQPQTLHAEVMRKVWILVSDLIDERSYIRDELIGELTAKLQMSTTVEGDLASLDSINHNTTSTISSSESNAEIMQALETLQSMKLIGDEFIKSRSWLDAAVQVLSIYSQRMLKDVGMHQERSLEIISLRGTINAVLNYLHAILNDHITSVGFADDDGSLLRAECWREIRTIVSSFAELDEESHAETKDLATNVLNKLDFVHNRR